MRGSRGDGCKTIPAGPLDRFPRVPLGHWPTPLQFLPRLTAHLGGPEIWMKRDDCSGLGLGGNKTRKLEFLLGEAETAGVQTIITVGGVQSNHACQTAAAAARLGLACHLILVRVVEGRSEYYETSGNIPVEHLFGAKVQIVDDETAALSALGEVMKEAEARGGTCFLIPAGGSTPTGVLGFVAAAGELCKQERDNGFAFDRVVVATSTAGTVAGLATGFSIAESERPLEAVMVYEPAEVVEHTAHELVDQTASLLGVVSPGLAAVSLLDGYLGGGYGVPSDGAVLAVRLLAELEGILIDPVYTAKAMYGLIDRISRSEIDPGERVVFWHTGGVQVLQAYPEFLRAEAQ